MDTMPASQKTILLPIADGFEEMEFIAIADILRRANIEVIIAGIEGKRPYKGAHDIEIIAPKSIALSAQEISTLDGIALAGGYEGMQNLKKSQKVLTLLQTLHLHSKLISAICASPIVLDSAGVLFGDFTCYPGCEQNLTGTYKQASVVRHDNLITASGPATAQLFALEIVQYLLGQDIAKSIGDALLMPLQTEPSILR